MQPREWTERVKLGSGGGRGGRMRPCNNPLDLVQRKETGKTEKGIWGIRLDPFHSLPNTAQVCADIHSTPHTPHSKAPCQLTAPTPHYSYLTNRPHTHLRPHMPVLHRIVLCLLLA